MATYKLVVDNYENTPHINATFDNVPKDRLLRAVDFAHKAFRNVEATAEETGEIIFTRYTDSEWFCPAYNCGEALDILSHICYDEEW